MDIHTIRMELRTKSIYDLPLRVTYYARVSSESDEQLNSLGNQVSYYEDLIRRNLPWTFVPGYIDEGLSGISTKKRENFNRMIEDAAEGQFDLVITKEISRFARNTLDSIRYTRQLLSYGVGVFFQNDNINTFDEDAELRLSIMSSIAQDELRKLSSRVKFGHQQAIKSSVVLGNSRIFGYTKADGKLVIDETEAPMVRELFELYATGEYSMKQLETLFWDKGYRNHNGKKIAHTTMSNIISNPKYKGYYVGNKVKVVDMFTKSTSSSAGGMGDVQGRNGRDRTGDRARGNLGRSKRRPEKAQRGRESAAGRLQPRQSPDRKAMVYGVRSSPTTAANPRTRAVERTVNGSAPARSKTARIPVDPLPSTKARSSRCCSRYSAIRLPMPMRWSKNTSVCITS